MSSSRVAIVTMTGTCCPVTKAHIQAFVVAKSLLKSKCGFDVVIGGLSLNSDRHVAKKLREKGLNFIKQRFRQRLVESAIQGHEWLHYNPGGESNFVRELKKMKKYRHAVHYALNGADVVLKDLSKKRTHLLNRRQIIMCRPGSTEELKAALRRNKVRENSGFIVGPELPDISSTQVREALAEGDQFKLMQMLHIDVAKTCWHSKHVPYWPPRNVKWCEALEQDEINGHTSVMDMNQPALQSSARESDHSKQVEAPKHDEMYESYYHTSGNGMDKSDDHSSPRDAADATRIGSNMKWADDYGMSEQGWVNSRAASSNGQSSLGRSGGAGPLLAHATRRKFRVRGNLSVQGGQPNRAKLGKRHAVDVTTQKKKSRRQRR